MDANYTDMLKCLNGAGVDYILVGGWTVNLLANKKASGRTKDLADVEVLERIGK